MDFEGNRFNPIFTTIGYIQRRYLENHVQGSRTVTHTELDNFTACSPVLNTWLRWNLESKCPGRMTLFPFSNNQNAVKVLTNYIQGHEVIIMGDVLPEVLSLGDMLQVDKITNFCKHLILNEPLRVDNCLPILKLCSLYNIEHPKIDNFIRGNLIELSQMEDMLCITMNSLDILLTDEELSYWPMDDRFVFISAWCNAQKDRLDHFETLFKQLDLYKIDRYFIEVVIKKDVLVSRSKLCLDLINMHLCDRKDKPVPFVFVINARRLESNVLGFNLEDEKLYQFRFPDQVADSSLLTVAESGHILSIKKTNDKMYLYDYDVNSNTYKEKVVQTWNGKLDVSHILDAQGKLVLIAKKNLFGVPKREQCDELYLQVSDDGKSIQIEPIRTLEFDVAGACFSQSMIIMSASTFGKFDRLFFFHLETRTLTVSVLKKMINFDVIIPFETKLFVASVHTSCIYDLVTSSTECIIRNEHVIRFPLSSRYVFLSKSIIRIDHNYIKILNVENERDFTHSFHLERLKLDYQNNVAYGYLDRKRPLCHIMCPHCDPNAWEKEEEERIRRKTQFTEFLSCSDDDKNDFYDYYDSSSDNGLYGLDFCSDSSENESI